MILPNIFLSKKQINKAKEIYIKYMTERISPYLNLTGTDSICIFLFFICKPESCTPDSQFRDVLLEVMIKNNILHIFDISHKSWGKYSVRNEPLRRKPGCKQKT